METQNEYNNMTLDELDKKLQTLNNEFEIFGNQIIKMEKNRTEILNEMRLIQQIYRGKYIEKSVTDANSVCLL